MASVQAAGAAKTRNAQVNRRARQRRTTISNATGASFEGPNRRSTTPSARTPKAPRGPSSTPQRRSSRPPARSYTPIPSGEKSGSVGALEAEFLGAIALLFLTLFTDTTSSYSDKILAVMKRGTLVAISFFILALVSAQGPNAARFAKAFGALIDAGLILSVGSTTMLSELDSFFKGTWTSTGESAGGASSSGAQAGSGNLGSNIGSNIQKGLNQLNQWGKDLIPQQIKNLLGIL